MNKLDKLIENAIKATATTRPLLESKSQQIIRRLREDTAYQEFFKKALEKYGVNSPSDFDSDEKKKEFFNYIDKNYSATTEGNLDEYSKPRGYSANFKKGIEQFKSVMQTFFQKLKLAPRDVQRDFAQLYGLVIGTNNQLGTPQVVNIVKKLKPILKQSGFKVELNDHELTLLLIRTMRDTTNLATKVPASVLAEAYFPTDSYDEPSLRDAKKALATWFNNTMQNPNSPIFRGKLDKQQLDILHDLIDDYAMEYARNYADNIDMERNTF